MTRSDARPGRRSSACWRSRGLEDEGQHNVARLFRAAAFGEGDRRGDGGSAGDGKGRRHPDAGGHAAGLYLPLLRRGRAGGGARRLPPLPRPVAHVRAVAGRLVCRSDNAGRDSAGGGGEPGRRPDDDGRRRRGAGRRGRLAAAGDPRAPARLGAAAGRPGDPDAGGERTALVPVDPNDISASDEPAVPPAAALPDDLVELRRATVTRFAAITPEDWQRAGVHPEFGRLTVTQQLAYLARHGVWPRWRNAAGRRGSGRTNGRGSSRPFVGSRYREDSRCFSWPGKSSLASGLSAPGANWPSAPALLPAVEPVLPS